MTHPAVEFLVSLDSLGIDAEPAVHFAASHLETPHVWLTHQSLSLSGIDAQQQTALAAGADGHVAVDQEGEAAEHAFLGQAGLLVNHLPDPLGEYVVIRHAIDCDVGRRQKRRQRGVMDPAVGAAVTAKPGAEVLVGLRP
jgi:hypothetical protein